jgi:hypothetical protein
MSTLNITNSKSLVLAYASDKITLETYNKARMAANDAVELAKERGYIGVGLITAEDNAIAYAMRPFIANREALSHLLKWLDDGAHGFNMRTGIEFTEEGAGDCGTTCCIGGAVAQMAMGIWDKQGTVQEMYDAIQTFEDAPDGAADIDEGDGSLDSDKMRNVSFWQGVPEIAIAHLGIDTSRLGLQTDDRYGLDLFDSDLAPDNCTPAQAAQAVRNFDATGEPMWGTV